MEDAMPLTVVDNDSVVVHNLTPHFKLCCKDGALCTLCLVIDTEIGIEDEDHSGLDEEDREETRNPKGMNEGYMQPTVMLLLITKKPC